MVDRLDMLARYGVTSAYIVTIMLHIKNGKEFLLFQSTSTMVQMRLWLQAVSRTIQN